MYYVTNMNSSNKQKLSALDRVCEALESGALSSETLLNECLQYMSSDQIEEVLHVLGFDEDDE